MRLIDADKVCEILDDIDGFTFFAPESVKQLLEEVPTIEPKRGKWERLSAKLLRCSVCGRVTDEPTTFAFCPSCGAKMEGGENND